MKCRYEGNGVWEGRCTATKEVEPCPGYDKCKSYKPCYMTNADRIRAMTDEELADFMNCDGCPPKNEGCNEGQNCSLCWLNWLKQPCEAVQPITERPDGQS